jgi:hypothetical protein
LEQTRERSKRSDESKAVAVNDQVNDNAQVNDHGRYGSFEDTA